MKKHFTRSISLPCGLNKLLLGVALLLSVATSNAIASPSVNGTRISWPDDGWYQVQTADGSQSLCNGGSYCDVNPGRYLVINHATGERFINVKVSSADDSGITVNGSQISWPDGGWYQVQSEDGSQTFCNGGSDCDVDPGVYLVINHTTGERFSNIEVGNPSNVGITVSGSQISWPDDGWYQVQTADGSQALCNGGSFCDVGPGQYLVINHTTGERFNKIEVSGDASNLSTFVDDDLILPIEDSVLGSAYASRYFESRITDERPLYETYRPSVHNPYQDSLSGNVDIDVDGNGTLIRNTKLNSDYDNKQGTRTHSKNTVSWEGVVTGSQYDVWYTFNFSNTITLIDESTRSYTEERAIRGAGTYTSRTEDRSNLIGRLIEGTSVCEPIAGTYYSLYTGNYNRGRTYEEIFVSREMGEPYWRVSEVYKTYNNPELVTTEYFARELSMISGDSTEEDGFICDVVEFKN